jgi:hypothetical protein
MNWLKVLDVSVLCSVEEVIYYKCRLLNELFDSELIIIICTQIFEEYRYQSKLVSKLKNQLGMYELLKRIAMVLLSSTT